jgi:hypothetical protein
MSPERLLAVMDAVRDCGHSLTNAEILANLGITPKDEKGAEPALTQSMIDETYELHDHLAGAQYRNTIARSFYMRGYFDRAAAASALSDMKGKPDSELTSEQWAEKIKGKSNG